MESAFGVEHGDISKMSRRQKQVAAAGGGAVAGGAATHVGLGVRDGLNVLSLRKPPMARGKYQALTAAGALGGAAIGAAATGRKRKKD